MSNPYAKPTKEDIEREKSQEEELQRKIKSTIALGRKCMEREEFTKYKESYVKARESVLQYLMDNIDPDPVKFAFRAIAVLNKVQTMKHLIDMVEKDAKRKI